MTTITTSNYNIHFNETCYSELNNYLKNNQFSKVFIIVDTNTHEFCLPKFLSLIEAELNLEIIEIEAGEVYKNIETCDGVWNALSELDGDRKSLIINLGGGVITDLGGFVASTFKRGIKFINAPTTLLSMVDASVGGKTGVDLDALKNQIGMISFAEMVLIDTSFLNTLPKKELISGFAEMLKHGLIKDRDYWNALLELDESINSTNLDNLIYESVEIKNEIVTIDPKEETIRKTLNYGHTLGHAIESYCLTQNRPLLHGYAVAIGMVLESYISYELTGFDFNDLEMIKKEIISIYGKEKFNKEDILAIIELLKYDKKNSFGNINFVLLDSIGNCKIDEKVDNKFIFKAFEYYAS